MVDTARSALIANWLGAVGQCTAALLLAYIGFITYRFTKHGVRANAVKYINEMANDMNKTFLTLQSPISEEFSRIYKPVVSERYDFMYYIYLNYAELAYLLSQDGLVEKEMFIGSIKDAPRWLASLTDQQLKDLLDTGYTEGFKNEMLSMRGTATKKLWFRSTKAAACQSRSEASKD